MGDRKAGQKMLSELVTAGKAASIVVTEVASAEVIFDWQHMGLVAKTDYNQEISLNKMMKMIPTYLS